MSWDYDLDIDFDAPDAVPEVLRTAADRFCDAECDLDDADDGKVWRRIARILSRAAEACERTVEQREEF